MSFVEGEIVKGKVAAIKKFGAFIKLENGKTGLCHISEVSNDYVKDIDKYIKLDQEVKVKIIKINGDKLSLSIKACNKSSENNKPKEKYVKKSKPKNFEKMLSSFMDNSSKKLDGYNKKNTRKGNGYDRDY